MKVVQPRLLGLLEFALGLVIKGTARQTQYFSYLPLSTSTRFTVDAISPRFNFTCAAGGEACA